ncbi:sigma-70 family RNA polymerase sigma factor [Piscinibacter sp. Jin2]|uniref:Sigma-70 family RNA polymerase sigma factor n=1 Tax=Aquariibacter lacus TaxID=2801332 RepID=A0A9X1BNR9_9BURK|nr:sigma-70 family RNA polymerase sigma factor [Piscinibacter lacus]
MSNDLAALLEDLRPQLMRYARLQTRNEAWAEDAVSETLLVALEKPGSFAGRSQLKTWLIGILKHKLVDQLRKHSREITVGQRAEGEEDRRDEIEALLFDDNGGFREMPVEWGDPQAVIGQQQFLAVLDACVEVLPERLGRVFMMREWLELETEEICKELGITSTNLWVMLHRARLRLRECLQVKWFGETSTAA